MTFRESAIAAIWSAAEREGVDPDLVHRILAAWNEIFPTNALWKSTFRTVENTVSACLMRGGNKPLP